jgi:hypothetical protein
MSDTAKTSPPSIERFENTTDATRGEPIGLRAQKRRAELQDLLWQLPEAERSIRSDISIALAEADQLLTGDSDHPSYVTAANLSLWLERTKHIAEAAPDAPRERS